MHNNRAALAIVPAAGLGTRLRPLTDCIPKEMLPIGRWPVIGHVLSEIALAGLQRARVVLSPSKDLIRDYLGDGERWAVQVSYAVQPRMRGVGDAILTGLTDEQPQTVLALFGDCALLRPPAAQGPIATQRLMEAHIRLDAQATVLCEHVPRERTRHYGVLIPDAASDPDRQCPFPLAGIIEKPDPATAPSQWVVAARWVLSPDALDYIRGQSPGANGEVGVTEAIARLIADGGRVIAVPMLSVERRCDVGNWQSLLTAQALASAWDPELGQAVMSALADADPDWTTARCT